MISPGPETTVHELLEVGNDLQGREDKVQHCHPPKSLDQVNAILQAFRDGSRDRAEFWIPFKGQFLYITYHAVRDADGRYLGTLEVTMDATRVRSLKGERRLLEWS